MPPTRSRYKHVLLRAFNPSPTDMMAYFVLILAATGLAPDELGSLRVSDIEWHEQGLTLSIGKARAGKSRTIVLKGSAEHSPWGAVGLFERIRYAGSALRTAYEMDDFWLGFSVSAAGKIGALPYRSGRVEWSFRRWAAFAIDPDESSDLSLPLDIRRIRKAVISQRAIKLDGRVPDIAADVHTVGVFRSHYSRTTSLKVYSANNIQSVQDQLEEIATLGLSAFQDSRADIDPLAISETTGVSIDRAKEIRSGEMDMGTADCKNPLDSPFSGKGRLCTAAPLFCMACSNAVVFKEHFPNIEYMVRHLEKLRDEMDPKEWWSTWGPQYEAASAILDGTQSSDQHRPSEIKPTDLGIPVWNLGEKGYK